VRDPEGKMDDCYLMATNLSMGVAAIIERYDIIRGESVRS